MAQEPEELGFTWYLRSLPALALKQGLSSPEFELGMTETSRVAWATE